MKTNIANKKKNPEAHGPRFVHLSDIATADVPNNICKDSAIRHPRFWRIRFLNVFPIQMHREANLYDHYFSNFGRPPSPMI